MSILIDTTVLVFPATGSIGSVQRPGDQRREPGHGRVAVGVSPAGVAVLLRDPRPNPR